MPEITFNFKVVRQKLDDDSLLLEAIGFPEIAALGGTPKRALTALKNRVAQAIENSPPGELYRRHAAGPATLSQVSIVLPPPRHSRGWSEPVTLTFHALRWDCGPEMHVAHIVELAIEVVAHKPEELEKRVESHIRFGLQRTKAVASLHQLALLQRVRSMELDPEPTPVTQHVATPAEIAREDTVPKETAEQKVKKHVTNLRLLPFKPAFEIDDVVVRLADLLGGRNARSVLLVGPSGCGKTAVLMELIRRSADLRLGATPFWQTSGARLVAGASGFGMWQERCQQLCRVAAREKAIVHLGNLMELAQVGRSIHNQQAVASFLRPYLGRGDFLAVAECTPEQLSAIERQEPHLANVFTQLKVEEPNLENGRKILRQVAATFGWMKESLIDADAIVLIDRLHRRYATYSAYPGRPLRFLKNILRDRERIFEDARRVKLQPKPEPIHPSDVITAFSRETGLPAFMLDDAVPLDLDSVRQRFSDAVIGQAEAVDLVVDLLGAIKVHLTRPRKPMASLLFIGPTGVGKTELAKILAEFLFGDRQRMIRIDMSEYSDPVAVQRLIGGFGMEEGLLTAKVREQPFSVVLLDEFEKADPAFFTLLLQVMGEGRLTDAAGRVADFSNAVIIMTSNLGAQSYQKGPAGFLVNADAAQAARDHFTSEVRKFLRPEIFNRIDRIVPFAPLSEEIVLSIARREIDLARKRDGLRLRKVTLSIPDEAISYLARKGFDPRYGARPLKRAISRELLGPLSEGLNRYHFDFALQAEVLVEAGNLKVSVETVRMKSGKMASASLEDSPYAGLAKNCVELRRRLQKLLGCSAMADLTNTATLLEKRKERLERKKFLPPVELVSLTRLPDVKQAIASGDGLFRKITLLEQDLLMAVYEGSETDRLFFSAAVGDLTEGLRRLIEDVFYLRFTEPDYLLLAIYSEEVSALWQFAAAYNALFRDHEAKVQLEQLKPVGKRNELARLVREEVKKPAEFLATPQEGCIGLIFTVKGSRVWSRFEKEGGLHSLKEVGNTRPWVCAIETSQIALREHKPPAGVERRGGIAQLSWPRCRAYDRVKSTIDDAELGTSQWHGDLANGIKVRISDRVDRAIEEMLDA